MRFILFVFLCWVAHQLGAQDFAAASEPSAPLVSITEPVALTKPGDAAAPTESLTTSGSVAAAESVTSAEPFPPAPAPQYPTARLAYRQPTSVGSTAAAADRNERYSLHYRRERTLLGDLNLTGLWGGPTYNYSMTGDDWALVRGGFGLLEFSDEVSIGYGGWSSREDFTTNEPVLNDAGEETFYSLRHGGFIVSYAPLRDATIHPRVTMIAGPGRVDIAGDELDRDRIFVGQAMAGVELNVFQWFRLGFEGGYRFAAGVEDDNPFNARDVSGAVVQIEARFGFSW